MNVKEKAFSDLEKVFNNTLEGASKFFQSKKSEFEKLILPKMVKMTVFDKSANTLKNITLYRDVMIRDEYEIDSAKMVREVGVVLTSKMELARLEIVHVFCDRKENERVYISEVGLGDIPMLALFVGSLEIDIQNQKK